MKKILLVILFSCALLAQVTPPSLWKVTEDNNYGLADTTKVISLGNDGNDYGFKQENGEIKVRHRGGEWNAMLLGIDSSFYDETSGNFKIGTRDTTTNGVGGNVMGIGSDLKITGPNSLGIGKLITVETHGLAIGNSVEALGGGSTAIGMGDVGDETVALRAANVFGRRSLADTSCNVIGYHNRMDGTNNISIGSEVAIKGYRNISLGNSVTDTTINSIAIGQDHKVSGYNNIQIGNLDTLTGTYNIGIGEDVKDNGFTNVIAIGRSVEAVGNNEINFGANYDYLRTPTEFNIFGSGRAATDDIYLAFRHTNLSIRGNYNAGTITFNSLGAVVAILNGSKEFTLGTTSGVGTGTFYGGMIVLTSPISTYDSLLNRREVSKIDSATIISLATGVAGWGEVMIGDNQEWASFRFTSAGVVTLITNSTNVGTTAFGAAKLNIYDAGTGVAIQNYLSATQLKVAVNVYYYTP